LPNVSRGEPAAWLVANLDVLRPRGRVLDVASGRGRNTMFLLRQGWPVHAVDRDGGALADLVADANSSGQGDDLAGLLTTACVDLEGGDVSLGSQCFDAVIVFNYLHRPLMPAIVDAVAPGGVLIYETFTRQQASRGHPRNPAFLLNAGELPALIAPLRVVRGREGDIDGRFVASVVAMR
jgi:SAM-dependent methyltransferase